MKYESSRSFGFFINQAANKIRTLITRELEPYGIAAEQFGMMKFIGEHESTTQSTLADAMAKGKPTISRTLDVLEQKGYIHRKSSERDRRAKEIRLTDEGRALLETVTPIARRLNEQIHTRLDPQQVDDFFTTLQIVVDTIEVFTPSKGNNDT